MFGDSNSSRPNKKACWPSLLEKTLGADLRLLMIVLMDAQRCMIMAIEMVSYL